MGLDHGPHAELGRHQQVEHCAGPFLLVDCAQVQAGGEVVFHFAEIADEDALSCEVVEGVEEGVAPGAPDESSLGVVDDRDLRLVRQGLVEGAEGLGSGERYDGERDFGVLEGFEFVRDGVEGRESESARGAAVVLALDVLVWICGIRETVGEQLASMNRTYTTGAFLTFGSMVGRYWTAGCCGFLF